MVMEKELRQALQNGDFVLHYQPQVNFETQRIVGVEALIRWDHAERGVISPMEFIPLAEETGLIVPLGEWVLRTACQQNKRWQDAGLPPVCIAINLSMRQFQEESLVDLVAQVLQDTGLDPQYLELEITESVGLKGVETVICKLNALKQLGVRVAIDDFGTGYSSLHYLQKLPIDSLKVDRSFVRAMSEAKNGVSLISSILSLGKSLQLDVLVEGVEQIKEVHKLHELGCDRMQGYVFSRPLSPADLESTLINERKFFRDLYKK